MTGEEMLAWSGELRTLARAHSLHRDRLAFAKQELTEDHLQQVIFHLRDVIMLLERAEAAMSSDEED